MPKAPHEITAKVLEIFNLARASSTPMSVLSLQSTIVLGQNDWEPEEVEKVSSEVMSLLIRIGWKGFTSGKVIMSGHSQLGAEKHD